MQIDNIYKFKPFDSKEEYVAQGRYTLLIPELLEENLEKMRVMNSLVELSGISTQYYHNLWSNKNLIVATCAFKYGVIDIDKNLIIPFEYDSLSLENNLVIVGVLNHRDEETNIKNYKYGVLDFNNNEILPTIYDRIEVTDNSIITVKTNKTTNKKECISYDRTGKEKFTVSSEKIYINNGIIGVKVNDKYEIYNENKEKIIPFLVDSASGFFGNRLIKIENDEKKGLYDKNGNTVFELGDYDISVEPGDKFIVSKNEFKSSFIYRNGNKHPIDFNSCNVLSDEFYDIYYSKELNEDKEIEFIIIEKQTLKQKLVKLGFNKDEFPNIEYNDGILKLIDKDDEELDIIYDVKRAKTIRDINTKRCTIHKEYGLISKKIGLSSSGFEVLYDYDKKVIIPGIFNSINILNDEYAIVSFHNTIDSDEYLLNYKKIKKLTLLEEEIIKKITNLEDHTYVYDMKEKKYIQVESWNLISENKKLKSKNKK